MFRLSSLDRPIVFKIVKKKKPRFTSKRSKNFNLQAHDVVLLINNKCSMFRHLIVVLIMIHFLPSDYTSYRLSMRINT